MNQLLDILPGELNPIGQKILAGERITSNDGIELYQCNDIASLGMLANFIREKKNGNMAYFNINFHLEPTNICIYNCRFCSYNKKRNDPEAWFLSINDIIQQVKPYQQKPITEIHIVGGVYPDWGLNNYVEIITTIRELLPEVHIKAFSAVEIGYIIRQSGLSANEVIAALEKAGLNSIPGGGAEIFAPHIREQICPDKVSAKEWLAIHQAVHERDMTSNATMLYGHIESYEDRIDHMEKIRQLQDETRGFNAFIPLKYRKENNDLSFSGEISLFEDLKNYAVSRIFMDNITHLKAYWPMIGKDATRLSLDFGVDDLDGTIDDTTKIYSMAGVDEPQEMNVREIINLIESAGRTAIERDSVYQPVYHHKNMLKV